jgi:hypothetical protein
MDGEDFRFVLGKLFSKVIESAPGSPVAYVFSGNHDTVVHIQNIFYHLDIGVGDRDKIQDCCDARHFGYL